MCSTGMRVGAIADLRLKHLHTIQQHQNDGNSIYQIMVYENAAEQYYTFCTPECTKAIDDYLNYRKQYGEILTPESPLLREQFDKTDVLSINNTKPLSHNTIAVMVHQALVDAGLRKPAESAEQKMNLYKVRYGIMQSHGFRKFFFTNLVRSEAIAREYLMGHRHGKKEHGITELMMVSDKPEESDLFKEYLKAIDLLTISEEKHLRQQVENLKTEILDIDTLKKMHLETKIELEKERQERTKLYERLYKQGIIKVEA
jgi:integrase